MAVRCGGGTVLASGIRTRERKERKLYSDDWALGDEEIEGHHTFNLDEKINNPKFNLNFVKDMTNIDFDLSYIQKNGFNWPLLFKDKKQLGIVIPEDDFSINDVRLCVGSRRMLDVMDVNTQKNVEMTMKDWQRYYESQDKDKLLNVISLEFSHTRLETLVEAPSVVRQIDWVEKVWPRHLKEAQTESTNVLEDMMYPKVQKYCLMSVSGCYTDFHIDFGGTSVWYHILRGKKIFWLIPPSERNLQLYEQWVLSGKQGDIFFGDTVEKCARVILEAGDTFFIPTGWIHAVYTPDDSLVFGGNFLHSFGIEKQLRVASVEDTTHVPQKFRYPFFTEMLWYLLERYVHVLLGRSHLSLPHEEQQKYEKAEEQQSSQKKEHTHLTQYELHGLKAIVMFLHSLPTSKKCVPELIKDPIALIRDVRTVVEEHRYDSSELAVTNIPVLDWWAREPVNFTVKRLVSDTVVYTKKRRQSRDESTKPSSLMKLPPNVAKVRHRRVRCKECEACTRDDCRECVFCKDMTRYGGQGTMKQTCKFKKCYQPQLPAACLCCICEKDGWMRYSTGGPQKGPPGEASSLLECSICFKITHLNCTEARYPEEEGIMSEDLPNSWECSECIHLGYNNKGFKYSRVASSRLSSAGSDGNVKSPVVFSEPEEKSKKVKQEPLSEGSQNLSLDGKIPVSSGAFKSEVKAEANENCDPSPPQMPTWEQLQARVSYPLVKPCWVVRPAPPLPETNGENDEGSGSEGGEGLSVPKAPGPPTMMKIVMLKVFSKLSRNDLSTVMRVCRQWAQWANDPSLWKYISIAHGKLTESHLQGIVRRQPKILCLDWSSSSYEQFSWLLPRLQQLGGLHCEGISWGVLRPLISPYCPLLTSLNLSFCEGVDDDVLCALLKPPSFHRPGHRDTSTRLRQLTNLKIAGTRVGDTGVAAIVRSLPFLTHLDMSNCLCLTSYAAELFANPTSLISHSLMNLDLRGCHRMSPLALPALACLPILSQLALDPCNQIPLRAIKVWGHSNGYEFGSENIMTRIPPPKGSAEDTLTSSDEEEPSSILADLKENASNSKEMNLKVNTGKEMTKIKITNSSVETTCSADKENYLVEQRVNSPKNSESSAEKETSFSKKSLSLTANSSSTKKNSSAENDISIKKGLQSSVVKIISIKKEISANFDNSEFKAASTEKHGSTVKVEIIKKEMSAVKEKSTEKVTLTDISLSVERDKAEEVKTLEKKLSSDNTKSSEICKSTIKNKSKAKSRLTGIDKFIGKNEPKDKDKQKAIYKLQQKGKSMDKEKFAANNKSGDNSEAAEKSRTMDNDKSAAKDKSGSKDKSASKEKSKNQDRPTDKYISMDKLKSTDKDKSTDTNKFKDKDKNVDPNKSTEKDNSTEKDKSMEKDRYTVKNGLPVNEISAEYTKFSSEKGQSLAKNHYSVEKSSGSVEDSIFHTLNKSISDEKISEGLPLKKIKLDLRCKNETDQAPENYKDKFVSMKLADECKSEKNPVRPSQDKNITSEGDVSCDNLRLSESESGPNLSPTTEGSFSELCRRSERSNKGSKYKQSLVERKSKESKKDFEEENNEIIHEWEDSESEEKTKLLKKKTKRNSPPSVFKRKLKKKIITRSKSLAVEIPKCYESENEQGKHSKDDRPLQSVTGSDDQHKFFPIKTKEDSNYITKLRKKYQDGESSQTRSTKTLNQEEKLTKKRQEETSLKKSKQLCDDYPIQKKDSVSSSLPTKRRKERKGSCSSSSSSCSISPIPSFASEKLKKLKVELEPIGKQCRRRSDGQKIPTVIHSVSSAPVPSSPSSGAGIATLANEKISNRERPERQHRSPRRLSMCQ